MNITLIKASEWNKIKGEDKRFAAAFGMAKNVSSIKKNEDGVFAKLSSIADQNYHGTVVNVSNERVINEINNI